MGGQRQDGIKLMCLNSKVDDKQPSLHNRIYSAKGISTAVTTSQFFMPNVLLKNYEKEIE